MSINNLEKNSGSVIIVVLMVLALMAITVDQLIRSTIIGSAFVKAMVDRERAKALALGGINIAIAQLNAGLEIEKKEKEDKEEKKEETKEEKEQAGISKFVQQLVSNLNRWQIFNFTEKIDGIDGLVKICISSEHGKINVNEAFDFKKQEFKKEFQVLLKSLEIPGKIPLGEFHSRLTEFLKKRGKKLCEVTELMTINGFENLDVFYHPPLSAPKGKTSIPNIDLYLFDIFTIWTDEAIIDPVVFSDALCAVFGLTRPRADDAIRMKEIFKKFAVDFKKDLGTDWDGNWKVLQPFYGDKPKVLMALKDVLAKKFSSQVYSVLSYGKVNGVEQQVLAIIKEYDEHKKDNDIKDTKEKHYFKIMRLYWL